MGNKERKGTEKEIKITNRDLVEILDFPDIILKNTYFWHSQYAAASRRSVENAILDDMYYAISSVVDKKHHTVERKGNSIYIDGVRVFYFYESVHNVYKSQNLEYIKECLKPEALKKIKREKLKERAEIH
jgi:hypothetical protein